MAMAPQVLLTDILQITETVLHWFDLYSASSSHNHPYNLADGHHFISPPSLERHQDNQHNTR